MKTTLTALTLILATSTAYAAEDWDNPTISLEIVSGDLDFSIDGNEDEMTSFEAGITPLHYTFGNVEADVRFVFSSDLGSADTMTLLGQYNMSAYLGNNFSAFGTVEAAYASDTSFENGEWFLNPNGGIMHDFSEYAGVYGEVGYSWNMSDDFDREGGYVEIGVPVYLSNSVTITPSVSHTFDTSDEVANFHLETTLNF